MHRLFLIIPIALALNCDYTISTYCGYDISHIYYCRSERFPYDDPDDCWDSERLECNAPNDRHSYEVCLSSETRGSAIVHLADPMVVGEIILEGNGRKDFYPFAISNTGRAVLNRCFVSVATPADNFHTDTVVYKAGYEIRNSEDKYYPQGVLAEDIQVGDEFCPANNFVSFRIDDSISICDDAEGYYSW